jgi:AcrR family transcriptional regulator
VPRLPGDDRVEGAAGRIPLLEPGHLDVEAAPSGLLGHPRIGLDPEHPTAGHAQLAGHDAGPTTNVDDIAGTAGDECVDQGLRVARAGPVVAIGVGPERLGHPPDLVRLRLRQRYGGHAPTLVGTRPLDNAMRECADAGVCSVPTGVVLRDPREQLFGAAERVLLRDGANGLTSRAVTAEAGVAKGVLHRHFADFDAFLAELVLDRIAQLRAQAQALLARAGTGYVRANVAEALSELFGPVTVAIVGLLTFRDDLRDRLRAARPGGGVPLLADATAMLSAYLAAERDLGRLPVESDVDTLALLLIGSGHLVFAGRRPGTLPSAAEVDRVVATVLH